MTSIVQRYAEIVFVLGTTGLAMLWPPLALIGAAAYFGVLAVLVDRRTPPEPVKP